MKRKNHVKGAVLIGSIAGFAASASAANLLGSDAFSGTLINIDRDSAAWTAIGPMSTVIGGMTYDSNHDVLYGISADTDSLYRINYTTGQATPIGGFGALGYDNANGLAYDPTNDIIYGTDNNTNELFTVDPNTGVATSVAVISGGFTEIEGLGYDVDDGVLYGLTALQRRVVSINVTTGEAQAISSELPSLVWRGMEWDPDFDILYLSAVQIFGDAHIYNYNPVNDRLDHRGDTIGVEAVQGLAFVPEPTALLLGLVALPWIGRRRGR